MTDRGPSRWDAEAAVKASSLPAPSRLLLLVLLTHVTKGTLTVPEAYSPSLSTLMAETGLSRGSVANHLNHLEQEGWLTRRRPNAAKARSEKARTGYQITIPASARAGLVQEMDQSETSPGDGPEEENALFAAGPGDGLVQEMDGASPGAGHNPMSFPKSSSSTKKKGGAGGNRSRAKASGEHPAFAAWYAEYPSKVNRPAAVKAFPKALAKAGGDVQVLIDGVKRYRTTDKVRRGYIQNPATWLNGEGWTDEPGLASTGTDGVRGHGPRARVNDIDWSQGGPRV